MELIYEIWGKYAKKVTSPSVKNALKNAKLSLNDETLLITVGTGISENNIRQESDLPHFIRQECNYSSLLIAYKVDNDLAPKTEKVETKKVSTKKEIWEQMKKENPLVDQLRETLDLKPD